ncbi:hypothetical protein JOE40_002382 [Arthrobacter sp. PvP102]|jgi:hypothetical protein|uniref:DUF2332 domain-containing protein n=1 Tax=unclassified Arthrobacter TaxID=235627 RepID=UPI001AE8A697|nr:MULTISPECIES: DUF2332 domain-containing protein [unclassified Arthrobacter]MBP1232738.1 hypothetical protein [Arthrobacter sp. PvP103]MBP1237873.1 hypothetical protein [Arthrobacter sp. PvP102]
MGTADWYRNFGTNDAPSSSPCYAEWSVGIADDPELIRRIEQWPHNKRQPLLILAAARFLGAGITPYREFREFLVRNWDEVSRVVLSRATQTNEAGRCATLLPSLAGIAAASGRPLALIEVGASAGLALYPDKYAYEYVNGASVTRLDPLPDDAPSPAQEPPVLRCTLEGEVPLPSRLPEVVWRAGIDLNPLDINNPDDVAWLEALIWPEQDFRRERLRRAIAIARQDPPLLVAGDLNEQLVSLAGQAPQDATLVVFHSAVMAYLDAAQREAFRATIGTLAAEQGCHWLSNEGHTVLAQADGSVVVPEMDDARLRGRFLLLQDGVPVAIAGPHGQSLEWL